MADKPKGNPDPRFHLWFIGRFILGTIGVVYGGYEWLRYRSGPYARRKR